MNSSMNPDLDRRIRDDNRRLHDAPGYADFYDNQLALIRNPWEQRLLRDDLTRIAGRLRTGFRALDLGCGTGNLTLKLVELGACVTGVDVSGAMLARLRAKLNVAETHPSMTLIARDVDEYLRDCDGSFELVCACSFLHHMPDYVATLTAAARHIAPGGCLYVVHEPLATARTDRMGRLLEWIDFRWQRFEARTGIGGRTARDDPYYDPGSMADYWAMDRGLEPDAMASVLRDAGLATRITTYDSKRHRILHVAARFLGTQHLLKIEAWRPGG